MSKEIESILGKFFKIQQVSLATTENNQPRVRPVSLLYFENNFYVATGTNDAKMPQIKQNPKFEFSMMFWVTDNSGYVRGAGEIEIMNSIELKQKIYDEYEFISFFWKTADDPSYTLLKLNVQEFEHMKPGEFVATKHKL